MLESSRNLTEDSQVDIRSVAHGKIKNISDEQKQRLIANRKPRNGFEFALYGKMNRYCNLEWFDTYKFLTYSEQEDGVYCLSCILFPTKPKNGSRTAKRIATSYTNWRKAKDYLFSHADKCEYHNTSCNRFDAFLDTQNNPSSRIDQRMISCVSEKVERNR